MRFDDFPEHLLIQLEKVLAPRIGNALVLGFPRLESDKVTLQESCQVWVLDLPQRPVAEGHLEDYRRPGELWHHQIKVGGKPRFYARSCVEASASGSPLLRLIEVAQSSIAEQFDGNLERLEALAGPSTEDLVVRLLIVPRFDDYSFGLFAGETIRIVVPFVEEGKEAMLPSSADDAFHRIQRKPPFFGLG